MWTKLGPELASIHMQTTPSRFLKPFRLDPSRADPGLILFAYARSINNGYILFRRVNGGFNPPGLVFGLRFRFTSLAAVAPSALCGPITPE